MIKNESKIIGGVVDVREYTRPVKIAYLVPCDETPASHMVLDAAFYEAYTRWAGVYTLLIPVNSASFLVDGYANWLEYFDPDFVYSYVDLDENLVQLIDGLCSPIALLRHKIHKSSDADISWRAYVSDWHHFIQPVSSMSTINSPSRQFRPWGTQEIEGDVTVATEFRQDFSATPNRLFSDNFGTAFKINHAPNPIRGLFKTVCLCDSDLPELMQVGTVRCNSMAEMLSTIADRRASPIAKFAMSDSEAIPRIESPTWSRSFGLFVGDRLLDRINFWNARHFTPTNSALPSTLILGPGFFRDEQLVRQLGNFLNKNNLLGNGNGPNQVSIRSSEENEEVLQSICETLQPHTNNAVRVEKTSNAMAIPSDANFGNRYFRGAVSASTFKVSEQINELIAKEPAHFSYVPIRFKGTAKGQWITELSVARHNNLSKYSNAEEKWVLPKRRKVVFAFTANLGKITNDCRLAILPTTKNFPFHENTSHIDNHYQLSLPSDEELFRQLVLQFGQMPSDDLRTPIFKKPFERMEISDKGQNLRGIISMFETLARAYEILTNKFWRTVIRVTKNESSKFLIHEWHDLLQFLPRDREKVEKVRERLNLKDGRQVSKYMQADLWDNLEYLVQRKIFFQIHQWRCKYCGHQNARSFDGVKIRNSCEICESEHFAPIDLRWVFQLNDFVHRALVKNTGLPVLWTLGYLQDWLSMESFWYLPEVDLFNTFDDPDSKNEIDILCVVDGKFYAVEVKLTASSFVEKADEIEKFIRVIENLAPDVAMLSFERFCTADEDVSSVKIKLAEVVAIIEARLGPHTKFNMIVAETFEEFNEHPPFLGIHGDRTFRYELNAAKTASGT